MIMLACPSGHKQFPLCMVKEINTTIGVVVYNLKSQKCCPPVSYIVKADLLLKNKTS